MKKFKKTIDNCVIICYYIQAIKRTFLNSSVGSVNGVINTRNIIAEFE